MKKLYSTILVLFSVSALSAQCMMQLVCNWVTCYGACDATAQAYPVNMVGPISYQWMPGGQTTQIVTGLCAGTYTCVAIDSLGCAATALCTVGSPAQLVATITSFQNASCQSCCDGYGIGSATGGTPPYVYIWTPSGQTTPTGQSLCVGTHTFCVVDANGCMSCDTIAISFTNEIGEQNTELDVAVYGNSGQYSVTAQFPVATSCEIIVTNALGELVQSKQIASSSNLNTSIDLSAQAAGLYLISVVTDSGIVTRRIVKQ